MERSCIIYMYVYVYAVKQDSPYRVLSTSHISLVQKTAGGWTCTVSSVSISSDPLNWAPDLASQEIPAGNMYNNMQI